MKCPFERKVEALAKSHGEMKWRRCGVEEIDCFIGGGASYEGPRGDLKAMSGKFMATA